MPNAREKRETAKGLITFSVSPGSRELLYFCRTPIWQERRGEPSASGNIYSNLFGHDERSAIAATAVAQKILRFFIPNHLLRLRVEVDRSA
jgi:hypothetical protein